MEFAGEMIVKASLHELSISEIPTTLKPDGRNSWRRKYLCSCPIRKTQRRSLAQMSRLWRAIFRTARHHFFRSRLSKEKTIEVMEHIAARSTRHLSSGKMARTEIAVVERFARVIAFQRIGRCIGRQRVFRCTVTIFVGWYGRCVDRMDERGNVRQQRASPTRLDNEDGYHTLPVKENNAQGETGLEGVIPTWP